MDRENATVVSAPPRASGAGGSAGVSPGDYQIGKHPVFPLQRLEALVTSQGYTDFCAAEEDKRCQADLMYQLFKRPERVVDELARGFTEVIRTKYAPDLGESRTAVDALDFVLKHPRASAQIKLFYVLHVVANEEETHSVIKAGYKAEGNMWEERWEPHFKAFVKELRALVHQLQNMSFGEPNVVERVEWFNAIAEIIYMSQ